MASARFKILFISFFLTNFAVAATESAIETVPEAAQIGLSEQFIFQSESVGDDYLIQIAEPVYFIPPESDVRAPVIYVVDGYVLFGAVSSASRMLAFESLSDYAYVVAIGYPTDDQIELNRLRTRDLVHEPIENIALGASGGGGSAFESFLNDELRLYIQANYPVDPERSVLVGHSLGGLFTATVLKNSPDAFDGYVIGSPSMQFDASLATEIHAMAGQGRSRRVFIGVGELETQMMDGVDSLEKAFSSPNSTFDLRRVTFENETHTSVIGVLISQGLRHVLSPVTQ